MIPDAPADVDIRALITIEQLDTLANRAGWSEPDGSVDLHPVITLFTEDFEVIKHQVVESEGKPVDWLPLWIRTYGALIDICTHLALTVEGSAQAIDMPRLAADLEGDGSECPIEDTHTADAACSWCGRRKVDQGDLSSYVMHVGQVRLIHLFSKDAPTITLVHERETDAYRWVREGQGDSADRTIEMFERLMVGALEEEGGDQ